MSEQIKKTNKSGHSLRKLVSIDKRKIKILKNTHSMKQSVGGKDKTFWFTEVCGY